MDADLRSRAQKKIDELIGPPLYYSERCKLKVEVSVEGGDVKIVRPCGDCGCQVIAPRRAVAVGEGGMNMTTRAAVAFRQVAAAITGRCV